MVQYGYKLMTEEHGPNALVENAVRAEEAGFDFVASSDHFHPWLDSQGHAPFAWSVLAAVAARTARIGIATGVTCPMIRYHPAIIAQAAATTALLSDGRFTLQLGSGERLNEHVVGRGWPSVSTRHAMLREAIEIIKALWEGGMQSYDGEHLTLEDARIFDLPDDPITLALAISGPASAAVAAELCDGIVATEPDPELPRLFVEAGGSSSGPRFTEAPLAYAATEDDGLALARERFRFGVPGWKVQAELPNPVNFEAATKTVRPEDMAELVGYGPDPERHVAVVKRFVDAGFDHVTLVGIGPDQDAFLRFWSDELQPRLRNL